MMRRFTAAAIAALLLIPAAARAQSRAQNAQKLVDMEHEFRDMVRTSGTQPAFNHYLSPDALLFRPSAVRQRDWAPKHPMSPDLILLWEPEFVDVSRAGDFGYTTGQFIAGSRSRRGSEHFGKYITIWQKQANGQWLAIFDGGIATPPAAKGPAKLKIATAPGYSAATTTAAARTSILAADVAWGKEAMRTDYSVAIREVADPNISFMRGGDFPMVGPDSVAAAAGHAKVRFWQPVDAVVSKSGDLGYTRGTYSVTILNTQMETGDYLRIWRRNAKGAWRIVLDITSPAQ